MELKILIFLLIIEKVLFSPAYVRACVLFSSRIDSVLLSRRKRTSVRRIVGSMA
jgi:hypothetical protein